MTFTKETAKELGRKGGKTPKAKTQAWNNIVGWLATDGGMTFKALLDKQSRGEDLSKPEKEFMEHYKDLLEYHRPKLSRTTVAGDKDNPIQAKVEIELVNANPNTR